MGSCAGEQLVGGRKSTNGVAQPGTVSEMTPSLKTSTRKSSLISRVWAKMSWKQVCGLAHAGGITVERSMERNIPCCYWGLLQTLAGCTHEQSGLLPRRRMPSQLVLEAMRFDRMVCSYLQPRSLSCVQGPLLVEGLVLLGGSFSHEPGTSIGSPSSSSSHSLGRRSSSKLWFQSSSLVNTSAWLLQVAMARGGGVKRSWWSWEEEKLLVFSESLWKICWPPNSD